MDIADWRKKIDELDRKLAALLNERAAAAVEIGRLKRNTSLPIYEPEREREVLDLMARGSVPSVLEAALACTALAACGADDGPRRPLLERIRSSQQPDGGWSAAALSWGMEHGRFWYGSRELTTAFCLEAIAPAEREPPRSEQDAS